MLTIISIPTFDDNYVWLIKETNSLHCCIVDPGQSAPVLRVIKKQGLILDAILITHHHIDHIAGIDDIVTATETPVVIYSSIQMPNQVSITLVENDDVIHLLEGLLTLTIMATPGHKQEHVIYYNDSLLFSGDTLFSAGCGRILDGNASQLFNSLQKIKALPDNVLIYPAHEYTQSNLLFGHAVEPYNDFIKDHIKAVAKLRQQGLPTLPTTLGKEKQINVFLRTNERNVSNSVESKLTRIINDEVTLFTELRRWKDDF